MKLIEDSWGDASAIQDMRQLQSTLGRVQSSLQEWEYTVFGSVTRELARLRSELEDERNRTFYSGPSRRERRLMSNISELLAREEIMAKQRSRIIWLEEGDRNTEFFHAKSKERAKCNHIKALRNAEGILVTDQKDIEGLANNFYMELFTSSIRVGHRGCASPCAS